MPVFALSFAPVGGRRWLLFWHTRVSGTMGSAICYRGTGVSHNYQGHPLLLAQARTRVGRGIRDLLLQKRKQERARLECQEYYSNDNDREPESVRDKWEEGVTSEEAQQYADG